VTRRGEALIEESPAVPAMLQRLNGDRPGDEPARVVTWSVTVTRRLQGDRAASR